GLAWKGSQPDRDRAVQRRVRWVGSKVDHRAGDLGSQLLQDRVSLVSIGLREEHGELVPAEAADDVVLAEHAPQQARYHRKGVVAGQMPVGVVEGFQAIDVD